MSQPPLDYHNPIGPSSAKSGWLAVGKVVIGGAVGVGAALGFMWLVAAIFPTNSRTATGEQAGVIFWIGVAAGLGSMVGLGFKRWLLAGVLGGAGLTMGALGFLVGLMSSITC